MPFVTLSKEQFESALPEVWQEIADTRAWERIYQVPTLKHGLAVRIYSTVDKRTNQTRGIGEDAIRIVYWDSLNNRPLGRGTKILRTEGRTTIEQRIEKRIKKYLEEHETQSIVDFGYVRAVLEHDSIAWMDFAKSLLENLNNHGSLTDNQLAYVLGATNPRGKPTFEARVLRNNPTFAQDYVTQQTQEDPDHESQINTDTNISQGAQVAAQPQVVSVLKTPQRIANAPGNDLVPTAYYPAWRYPFENFNPVQSQVFFRYSDDSNFVISANTSAGKTVCAEFFFDAALARGQKCLYMSPLKSLTQEKFAAWSVRYPDKAIVIMTGDYVLTEAKKRELAGADIILMTSEMVDSRTRRMRTENNVWLTQIGCMVVDESHIISTDRGHAVESGIMRFTSINKNACVVLLSATMPNVEELAQWLTVLNGKETKIVHSTWRPVELQITYVEYQVTHNYFGHEDFQASKRRKITEAVRLAMSKPTEKFLIFVHDKNTGKTMVDILNDEGEQNVMFHNAELELDDRLDIETSFENRTDGLRVLVSTSTLAWGRNLPARNVIIVGVHRGLQEVDTVDIIQMAGRAGRYGIDDEGFVFLIIPEGSANFWRHTFNSPRAVQSKLYDKGTLAFHILAEIDNGIVKDTDSLIKWFERSLASKQNMPMTPVFASSLIEDLYDMEMVTTRSGQLSITRLGKVSSWLYYTPYDVSAWHKNFREVFERNAFDDHDLAWAIGDIPTNDWGYIPRDCSNTCDQFANEMRRRGYTPTNAIFGSLAVLECLKGEKVTGSLSIMARTIKYDIRRIASAIELIDNMYARWGREGIWSALPLRVQYGVPAEMVPLTKLPGIGGVRAKKLWDAGLKTLQDVASADNTTKLREMFQLSMVVRIQKHARKLIEN